MRFIVDAQLPPALAGWLRKRGHQADHVRDFALDSKPDGEIIAWASRNGGVVITKDADFSYASRVLGNCRVVWIRHGNSTSRKLISDLEPVFGQIEQALAEGQELVEVSA